MTEKIQRFIRGYVRIRVRTVSYDRFLNICALHGFYIWDLTPRKCHHELNISIKDFQLRPLARKTEPISALLKARPSILVFRNRHGKHLRGFLGGSALLFLFSFLSGISEITGKPFRLRRRSFTVISKEEKATYGTLKNTIDCKASSLRPRKNFRIFLWSFRQNQRDQPPHRCEGKRCGDLTQKELPEGDHCRKQRCHRKYL